MESTSFDPKSTEKVDYYDYLESRGYNIFNKLSHHLKATLENSEKDVELDINWKVREI
jgi:hypothetical protein